MNLQAKAVKAFLTSTPMDADDDNDSMRHAVIDKVLRGWMAGYDETFCSGVGHLSNMRSEQTTIGNRECTVCDYIAKSGHHISVNLFHGVDDRLEQSREVRDVLQSLTNDDLLQCFDNQCRQAYR